MGLPVMIKMSSEVLGDSLSTFNPIEMAAKNARLHNYNNHIANDYC